MSTRRIRLSIAAVVLAPTLALSGCGHSSSNQASSSTGASTSAAADDSTGGEEHVAEESDMDTTCPTTSQGHFDKTTFVLHSGLGIGALQHWIIKPYREGKFAKGADGRIKAFAKAGAAALFVKHEVKKAHEDVKQDPKLCNAIEKPMSDMGNSIKNAVDKAKKGDTSGIDSIDGLTKQVMSGSDANGAHITPDENADITGKGKN